MFLVCVYITWHDLHLKNWEFHVSKMICLSLLGWTKFFNSLREKNQTSIHHLFSPSTFLKNIFFFLFHCGHFLLLFTLIYKPFAQVLISETLWTVASFNALNKGTHTHTLPHEDIPAEAFCLSNADMSLSLSLSQPEKHKTRGNKEKSWEGGRGEREGETEENMADWKCQIWCYCLHVRLPNLQSVWLAGGEGKTWCLRAETIGTTKQSAHPLQRLHNP